MSASTLIYISYALLAVFVVAFAMRSLKLARLPVPAAQNGRIHLVDGTLVSWYGPRIERAIETVRPLLAPSPPHRSGTVWDRSDGIPRE